MSRFAEASARAGRAVPDNPHVDWAKEREAAERLLSGGTEEEEAAPPPPAVGSPPPVDSVKQIFSWPPDFDLDGVDLSGDPHARSFRRPRPSTQRRVEVDDRTAPAHSQLRHEGGGSSLPPRASAIVVPPRETVASSKRRTHREFFRAEARGGIPRWVVIAVALLILFASAALLTYLLRHRQIAGASLYVRPFQSATLIVPIPEERSS